jgi:hypothetical protein
MSDTFAIASDLRILGDDELHVVAGGRDNVVPVRVCVRECTVFRYRDGMTETRCEPPKCGPPPKS